MARNSWPITARISGRHGGLWRSRRCRNRWKDTGIVVVLARGIELIDVLNRHAKGMAWAIANTLTPTTPI
jgi:hypothetical protein